MGWGYTRQSVAHTRLSESGAPPPSLSSRISSIAPSMLSRPPPHTLRVAKWACSCAFFPVALFCFVFALFCSFYDMSFSVSVQCFHERVPPGDGYVPCVGRGYPQVC